MVRGGATTDNLNRFGNYHAIPRIRKPLTESVSVFIDLILLQPGDVICG